jgi:transposase
VLRIESRHLILEGPAGTLAVPPDDEIVCKLAMLFEGECEGLGATAAAEKFGFTRQRYYQLLTRLREAGAEGLRSQKRGPKTNYRRTGEARRQVIRHRFLDPDASVEVIAQKLRQCGFAISARSVQRVLEEFGLQKKTLRGGPPSAR